MSEEDPKIGKHVLDLLTTGMYKEPCLIYREYIQNSADQIDTLSPDERDNQNRCRIVIDIDRQNARVRVRDFATGIPKKEFRARLLNIADSWKDPSKDKGFRGIGRLAGLAYCHKLIFETSARGERVVSRMEMDGDEMRKILRDRTDRRSAIDLIKHISTITQKEDDIPEYECFFTVTLEGVNDATGSGLLDVDAVRSLIEQIAPVPFSATRFDEWKTKIEDFAKSMGHPLQTYSISINGNTIVKPYKNVINGKTGSPVGKIGDVVFRKIKDSSGKVLAWAWAAVPDQGKQITKSTNPERMMRLRKDNIQIGMEDFFSSGGFFAEDRSNGYMIGEVHIVDPSIRPNADRNDLEVSEISSKFLRILKETLFVDLWNAAKEGNALSKALENIETYADALKQKRDKVEDVSLPYRSREMLYNELESAFKKAADGLALLKKTKSKLSGTPDDASAIDLLRHSKTAGSDRLEPLVVEPPKPTASPQPPSVPVPDVPPPLPKTKPVPHGGKPQSPCKPPRPSDPPTSPPVPPSLGDRVVKILCDSGLDIEKAIDVWTKIEAVLPR